MRTAVRTTLAALALLAVLEAVLAVAGLPSYASLVDPAAGFPRAARRTAAALRREVARAGRGERVPGTILWRYRPPGSTLVPVNSLGLRGPEPSPRRPGELRVAVLGGSSVYGWLVGSGETLPAAVERAVAAAQPERSVTVFNLGVEGFRFQQEVALLARLAPALDLDAAVFVTGGNDVLTAVLDGGVHRLEPWHGGQPDDLLVVRSTRPGVLGRIRELVKHSRLVTVAQLGRLRLGARRTLPSPEADRLGQELAASFVSSLAELREVAAADRLETVVVLQPLVIDRRSPSFAERVRGWRAKAAAPGLAAVAAGFRHDLLDRPPGAVPVVDGSDCTDGLPGTVFQDWIHLSPAGNAACGGRVAAVLLQRLPPT